MEKEKKKELDKFQQALPSEKAIRVLLVEDVKIVQTAEKMVLAPFNCNITVAESGTKAIELARTNNFDLVFLDIGLPDIPGIEVAKQIRAHEVENNEVPLPIIALTAHLGQSFLQQCLSAGIQQVIRKPLTQNRAKAILENWVLQEKNEDPPF